MSSRTASARLVAVTRRARTRRPSGGNEDDGGAPGKRSSEKSPATVVPREDCGGIREEPSPGDPYSMRKTDWRVGFGGGAGRARSARALDHPPGAHSRRRARRLRRARLPAGDRRRHRQHGADVEGRDLLPLPRQGRDLPGAARSLGRPAAGPGRRARRRRGRSDRQGRRRAAGAGADVRLASRARPTLPGRGAGRRPEVPQPAGRRSIALRGVLAAAARRGRQPGLVPPFDTEVASQAWFGAFNQVVTVLGARRASPARSRRPTRTCASLLLRSIGLVSDRWTPPADSAVQYPAAVPGPPPFARSRSPDTGSPAARLSIANSRRRRTAHPGRAAPVCQGAQIIAWPADHPDRIRRRTARPAPVRQVHLLQGRPGLARPARPTSARR